MDYTEGSLLQILMIALIIGSKSTFHPKTPPILISLPRNQGVARPSLHQVESSFIDPELQKHCAFLEDYLSKSSGEFFAGDVITGADIMLHFALEGATRRVPLSETSFPKLYAYVRRLQKRDGYARAAKRVSEANGEEYVPYSDLK
jgi:glutathione S-transferase